MGIISLPRFPIGLTSGYPDRIDLAEQVGRPGGVESVFEYRGAYFNVRRWLDTFLINTIDGFADPDIRDSREVNPGRDGETPFNAYYGGRTIVLSGKIRAHTLAKLRNMQMGLKEIFGDIKREYPLIVRTGDINKDVMIYCKKSQPIVMSEVQQDFTYRRDFQVTLRASNPYFFSVVEFRNFASFEGGIISNFGNDAFVAYYNEAEDPVGMSTDGFSAHTIYGTARITVESASGTYAPRVIRATMEDYSSPGELFVLRIRRSSDSQAFPCVPGQNIAVSYKAALIDDPTIRYPGVFSQPAALVTFYDSSNNKITELPWRLSSEGGIWRGDVVFTAPNNATSFDISHGTLLPLSDGTKATVEVWDFLIVIGADRVPNYFYGYHQFARWSGQPYKSRSEFINTTGLEGTYSVYEGNGYASIKSGKLIHNGANRIVRMKRDGFNKLRSFKTSVEFEIGRPYTSDVTGIIELDKLVTRSQMVFGRVRFDEGDAQLEIGLHNTTLQSDTLLASGSQFSISYDTPYWLQSVFDGDEITVEFWDDDPDDTRNSPVTSIRHDLTSSRNDERYGADVEGDMGISFGGDFTFYTVRLDNHIIGPIAGQNSATVVLENKGNAPAPAIIRVTGPVEADNEGDTAVMIRSTDEDFNTQTMIVKAPVDSREAVPSDHYLEIDTWRHTAKIFDNRNVFRGHAYHLIDLDSNWIHLSPGTNYVEFHKRSVSGSPTLEIKFRNTYI